MIYFTLIPTNPWGKRPDTYQTGDRVGPRVHQETVRENKISTSAEKRSLIFLAPGVPEIKFVIF